MQQYRSRADVPPEYTWNIDALFEDSASWESATSVLASLTDQLDQYRGRVTDSAGTLLATLNHATTVQRLSSVVRAYALMRHRQNLADEEGRRLYERAKQLDTRVEDAVDAVEHEIRELGRQRFETFADEEPDLEIYTHYVDDILRTAPHVQSREVESLLVNLEDVAYGSAEVYVLLSDSDISFPTCERPDGTTVELSLGNFTNLQRHPNREFRRSVHERFYERLGEFRNSIAASYRNTVKADLQYAEARNYETARRMRLDEANVPPAVYDRLVETVRDQLDVFQAHLDLKRRQLGLDRLRPWDLYAPPSEDDDPEIPFDDAKDILVESVRPLGDEYQSRLRDGLNSGWVDVYPTPDKKSGAYSVVTYDSQPYIHVNYEDDLSSLYTLAHEVGHSMHTQLATETQPAVYGEYDVFTAEIASTVNELLLTEYLLDSDRHGEFRRHALDEILERFRVTLLRQTMFAEFEHRMHERMASGEPLTADVLDAAFGELKEEYYASAEMDDLVRREWMRISHFHNSYKVYQYATGISVAVTFVQRLLDGDDRGRYLQFLRRGSSDYPLALLADANVDLTTPAPIERGFEKYEEYVDRASAVSRRR